MLHCNKRQAVVLQELSMLVINNMQQINRMVLESLICIQMYHKEAFDDLVAKRAFVPTDFDWERHIRYYWRQEDKRLTVMLAGVQCTYSWEYMGLRERLVCTSLTTRTFVAISQAMSMCSGCVLTGPIGTGKSETIRDLGRGMGRFVPTIHCSGKTDGKSLEKVLKGLASSGSWGCFDDLCALPSQVLSACAQHILCVLSAIRESRAKFVYTDGITIALDHGCGIFATCNFLASGQGDRMHVLPGMKSLFRGFCIMKPDVQAIINVKLHSMGFETALSLSKKLTSLYSILEEQLTKQQHYGRLLVPKLAV